MDHAWLSAQPQKHFKGPYRTRWWRWDRGTLVKRSPPPPNLSWPPYPSILEQQPCVTGTFSQSFHNGQRRPWHIRGAQLMWRGAIELFVHQRNPSPKINIIQNPRRFEEKNICVGFNRILTCILFSSLCIRSFSSHHQIGRVGRTYFFKDCTRLYSSKNRAFFFFQRYWTPNAAKYPCNDARKSFSRLDISGWLAASRRVLWIQNSGQKPRDKPLQKILGRHRGWPKEGAHTESRIWRPSISWACLGHTDLQDRWKNLTQTWPSTSNTLTLKLSLTQV